MSHRYHGLFNRDDEEEMKYLSKEGVSQEELTTPSSGIQFYTKDKHGQYQLWPRKSHRKEVVIISVLVVLIMGMATLFFIS